MVYDFSKGLIDMGFLPCKAELDTYMRKYRELLEYVVVYANDLNFVIHGL